MDAPQFANVRAALADVPDPRQARGTRYPRPVLLTLIAAALLSGQQGMRGIAQWVSEHVTELGPLVGLPPGRVLSAAPLRRTVRAISGIGRLGKMPARSGWGGRRSRWPPCATGCSVCSTVAAGLIAPRHDGASVPRATRLLTTDPAQL